ncbi:hypothetical protein M595_5420 [Lyngbya aestuarii BL J]|uniref:Uncharacterized protein n=1 Tax=Lyngbya aestuarii BL J TaxID=1348334 RepID=U7QC68_9CYAN|nr:hypothetical protein M595_5420 [Lyngbya aestuarii BL J]
MESWKLYIQDRQFSRENPQQFCGTFEILVVLNFQGLCVNLRSDQMSLSNNAFMSVVERVINS